MTRKCLLLSVATMLRRLRIIALRGFPHTKPRRMTSSLGNPCPSSGLTAKHRVSEKYRMELEKEFAKYACYWEVDESLPGLEVGKNISKQNLLKVVQDLRADQPLTFRRSYEAIKHHENDHQKMTKGSGFTTKILQWNLLAQGLSVGNDNFVLCPNSVLAWDYRKLLILEELLQSDADILCLQEVDKYWFLKNTLAAVGYEGMFFPKPSSPALYTPHTCGPDGCALFYNKSKLKLLKHELVNLRTLDNKFTNQVCILGVFCPLDDPDAQVCVATVHLKAKQGWHQLRYTQGAFLLKYIEENYSGLPVVICGDFNADASEPVYEAFKNSSLNLESVYTLLSDERKEPPYTTWKVRGGPKENIEVCKSIDYIWSSKDKVCINSLYTIPGSEDVGQNRLPSNRYPSDHLALAAEFSIKK